MKDFLTEKEEKIVADPEGLESEAAWLSAPQGFPLDNRVAVLVEPIIPIEVDQILPFKVKRVLTLEVPYGAVGGIFDVETEERAIETGETAKAPH